MVLHDWFDWTNASVGVAGLALTMGAIWQATGAKSAAREARQAVYRRNASDDVKRLERLASALLTAIETDQFELASHLAREFFMECSNVREHHRARLGRIGGKLEVAIELVRAISRELQAGAEKNFLIDIAQKIAGDMSTLGGVLSRNLEAEES
ncbi:MAG: hypothetical protein KGL37_05025 [Acidobacteriota bacterium]|nr:hypothetical protein [Acidobacteriota bacterium]